MPNTEDDNKKYPGIPDYSDTNSDPTILNSSNFGLTTAASKVEADKLSLPYHTLVGFSSKAQMIVRE